MEKWGQEMGTGPILLTKYLHGIDTRTIFLERKWGLAPFYLRFFLTGNSAGDKKRPIQKEGGFNARENN